jgi:hypothetical protein
MNARGRRHPLAISALIVALASIIPPAAIKPAGASETPNRDGSVVATLSPGDSVFWDGPYIAKHVGDDGRVLDPVLCGDVTIPASCAALVAPSMWVYFLGDYAVGDQACGIPPELRDNPCLDYQIEVTEGGAELAVALDHPSAAQNQFEVVLLRPDQTVADQYEDGCQRVCNTFELYAPDPAAGTWTFRVFLHNVENTSFRMRAILRSADQVAQRRHARAHAPNMRAIPPFEVGVGDCQTAEEVHDGAQRCLRFSTGPMNVGRGPLDLRPLPLGDPRCPATGDGIREGTVIQRIHNSDGTTSDTCAGTYHWHERHGHYHYSTLGHFELNRVLDAELGLTAPIEDRPKMGFCIGDATIADWTRFDNARQGDVQGRCTAVLDPPLAPVDPRGSSHTCGLDDSLQEHDPTGTATTVGCEQPMFYQGAGWGDPYPYWVEGNFIDIDGAEDGSYILLVTIAPDNDIIESNGHDNVSYAHFTIENGSIEVHERGIGAGPWDRDKEIANDTRWPTVSGLG